MATIVATSMTGSAARDMTETTLTGTADVFTYNRTKKAILILRNATAGALSPVIDGAGGTTVACPGVGSVSVASGYAVPEIAAGEATVIPLDTISAYLQGAISITSGTGLVASLLEY